MALLPCACQRHRMAWPCLIITLVMLCCCSVATIEPPQPIPKYAYLIFSANIMSPQLSTTIEPSDTVPSHWTLVPLQSWSLFLVCNPTWLGSGNAEKIHALYEQLQTFGRAIGPRHMAVWFWKRRRSDPSTFNEFLASQTKKTLWRQETVAEIVRARWMSTGMSPIAKSTACFPATARMCW